MSDRSSTSDPSQSSSKPTRDSSPQRRRRNKNDDSRDDSDKKPPTTVQSLLPTVVTLKTPSAMDTRLSTCFSWDRTTFRSRSTGKRDCITVCWTKVPKLVTPPPPPPHFLGSLSQTLPAHNHATSSSSSSTASSAASDLTETDTPPVEQAPNELPFFRGVLLNVHVSDHVSQNGSYKVIPTRYPNGVLKGVTPDPPSSDAEDGFKETLLGYEYRDPLGAYHYYVPMAFIHHRTYNAVLQTAQSIYAPAFRLGSSVTNRIHKSYESGKQYEAWNLIWDRVSSGEPVKLGQRLLGQVSVMAERSKEASAKRDEDERTGRRKD